MKKLLFSLLYSVMIISCNSSDNNPTIEESDKIIHIDHYKSLCNTSVPGMCYRSRENLDSEWDSNIYAIRNFEYEWGYTYKLYVNVEVNNDPDLVGNSPIYSLIEIIERERVTPNTLFDIVVPQQGDIFKSDDQRYYLGEEKEFICSTENCVALDTLLQQQINVLLEFSHQEESSTPLLLTQIKCSAPSETFNEDCL